MYSVKDFSCSTCSSVCGDTHLGFRVHDLGFEGTHTRTARFHCYCAWLTVFWKLSPIHNKFTLQCSRERHKGLLRVHTVPHTEETWVSSFWHPGWCPLDMHAHEHRQNAQGRQGSHLFGVLVVRTQVDTRSRCMHMSTDRQHREDQGYHFSNSTQVDALLRCTHMSTDRMHISPFWCPGRQHPGRYPHVTRPQTSCHRTLQGSGWPPRQ